MLINAQYASNLGVMKGAEFFDLTTQSMSHISDKATEFISPVISYIVPVSPTYYYDGAQAVLQAFIKSVDFGFIAGGIIILCGGMVGFLIKAKTTAQLEAEARTEIVPQEGFEEAPAEAPAEIPEEAPAEPAGDEQN
jgi:hypothetical protein